MRRKELIGYSMPKACIRKMEISSISYYPTALGFDGEED